MVFIIGENLWWWSLKITRTRGIPASTTKHFTLMQTFPRVHSRHRVTRCSWSFEPPLSRGGEGEGCVPRRIYFLNYGNGNHENWSKSSTITFTNHNIKSNCAILAGWIDFAYVKATCKKDRRIAARDDHVIEANEQSMTDS